MFSNRHHMPCVAARRQPVLDQLHADKENAGPGPGNTAQARLLSPTLQVLSENKLNVLKGRNFFEGLTNKKGTGPTHLAPIQRPWNPSPRVIASSERDRDRKPAMRTAADKLPLAASPSPLQQRSISLRLDMEKEAEQRQQLEEEGATCLEALEHIVASTLQVQTEAKDSIRARQGRCADLQEILKSVRTIDAQLASAARNLEKLVETLQPAAADQKDAKERVARDLEELETHIACMQKEMEESQEQARAAQEEAAGLRERAALAERRAEVVESELQQQIASALVARDRALQLLRGRTREQAASWRRAKVHADAAGAAARLLAGESLAQLAFLEEQLPDSANSSSLEPLGEAGGCGPVDATDAASDAASCPPGDSDPEAASVEGELRLGMDGVELDCSPVEAEAGSGGRPRGRSSRSPVCTRADLDREFGLARDLSWSPCSRSPASASPAAGSR